MILLQCPITCGGHTLDENLDSAHSYHLTILRLKKKGNSMGPQLHHDSFPQSTTRFLIGVIPEICVIVSAASNLTRVIHKSLRNSALLNIQEGVLQREEREISRDKKELGRRNKAVMEIYKIGRNFLYTKEFTGSFREKRIYHINY